MEAKKSPKANLENKRFIFTQVGLILTLALVLLAFEWKSYYIMDSYSSRPPSDDTPEDIVVIIKPKLKPPLPKPPPPPDINVVENEAEIEFTVEIHGDVFDDIDIQKYNPTIEEEIEIVEEEIITIADKQPSFPGGDEARIDYFRKNIKYPKMAREIGIQGTVHISFVVEKDGSITDIKILRSIGGGCDEEAIRLIENMPKWNAGIHDGKRVRVRFNLPMRFTLRG